MVFLVPFFARIGYKSFIESYLREQGSGTNGETSQLKLGEPGDIAGTSGEVLGRHNGLHNYTVGQRRGLGLAEGRPMYVVALDRENNRLVIGEDIELRSSVCQVHNVNWIPFAAPDGPVHARVKIRNRHVPATAEIIPLGDSTARITFSEPQRAITPGQAAVFYSGEQVLGGGWIASV